MDNVIYETIKNATGWQAPTTPYGQVFSSPDELTVQTAGLLSTGALWKEGSSAPYDLKYGGTSQAYRKTCTWEVRTGSGESCQGGKIWFKKAFVARTPGGSSSTNKIVNRHWCYFNNQQTQTNRFECATTYVTFKVPFGFNSTKGKNYFIESIDWKLYSPTYSNSQNNNDDPSWTKHKFVGGGFSTYKTFVWTPNNVPMYKHGGGHEPILITVKANYHCLPNPPISVTIILDMTKGYK